MLIRLGQWLEFEVMPGGVFFKAPLVGSVWLGFGGWYWDRPNR